MFKYSVLTGIFIVLEQQIARNASNRCQSLVLQYCKETGVVVNLHYFTSLKQVENTGWAGLWFLAEFIPIFFSR